MMLYKKGARVILILMESLYACHHKKYIFHHFALKLTRNYVALK